jgi:hypothetical protein
MYIGKLTTLGDSYLLKYVVKSIFSDTTWVEGQFLV